VNTCILNLSVFFEYGLIQENRHFPDRPLFLPGDYVFKTVHRANFYTTEEIAGIFSIIVYLPKVYGKILLLLHHCGMRISEVLRLPIDCLRYEDGVPYIRLYMYKTNRYHKVPLDDYAHRIIKHEIRYVQENYPDAQYVFLNSVGKPIHYTSFVNKVKAVLLEHNILGRDGKPLVFRTHRFRATKATELINMGTDPQIAADMLGQKSLSALSYYAAATDTSLNEHMQEYLKMESILINSIWEKDGLPLEKDTRKYHHRIGGDA
jgi:integrase